MMPITDDMDYEGWLEYKVARLREQVRVLRKVINEVKMVDAPGWSPFCPWCLTGDDTRHYAHCHGKHAIAATEPDA